MSLKESSDSRVSDKPHWFIICLWLALLVGVATYIFNGVEKFYFTCDDFVYLSQVKDGNVFGIHPQALHYVPIGILIGAFPGILVGPNPLLDNIFLISFYLVAMLLTIYVAHMATTNLTTSLAAGFLFLTFANNHELMFWKTGRITSAIVILCTLSFVLFARYLKKRNLWRLLLCNILLLISMLTLEQAVFIVPVWVCYELLFHFPFQKGKSASEHFADLWSFIWKYIPTLLLLMSLFGFKIYHGQGIQPGFLHLRLLIEQTIYGIFNYNQLLSSSGILPFVRACVKTSPVVALITIIVLTCVSITVCLLKPQYIRKLLSSSRNAAFFLFWGLVTYLPLFAIMGPQFRYYALGSVGITILVAIMLRAMSAGVGSRFGKFHSLVTELMILVLALAVSLPGLKLLETYKRNWGKASEVERNLVDSYRSYTENLDEKIHVYLLNVPDRLFAEADSFAIARNGFRSEISYYDKRPITFGSIGATIQSKYPVLLKVHSMGFCDVLDLTTRPDRLVLLFDRTTERLKPWDASSAQDANCFVAHDSGFHPWEFDPKTLARWRWTDGNAFLALDVSCHEAVNQIEGINFELAGSPYLSLHPVIGTENEELTRLEINHYDLRQYRILFPEKVKERFARQKRIELWIKSEPWRPSDYGLSPDNRLLGVSVGHLEFIKQADG